MKDKTAKIKPGRRPLSSSISLEELARQQNLQPLKDVSEMAKLRPGDDDPDELLAFILAERVARRGRMRRDIPRRGAAQVNSQGR